MPKPADVLRLLRAALTDPDSRHRIIGGLAAGYADVLELLEACRLSAFRAMPYAAYLRTEHWRAVSRRARERAGRRCQLCNEGGSLEVHHRTYERLGCELDEDLTVLCGSCHGRFHVDQQQTQEPDPPAVEEKEIDPINLLPIDEQIAWLQKVLTDKRRSMGISDEREPLQIQQQSSTLSGA